MFLICPRNENIPENRPPLKKKTSRSINCCNCRVLTIISCKYNYLKNLPPSRCTRTWHKTVRIGVFQKQLNKEKEKAIKSIKLPHQLSLTYWIRRNLPFCHECFSSVVQLFLHQIIININIKPSRKTERKKKTRYK